MFVGPEFLRQDDLPPVVIIGSGPAGLTLGLALAERRIPSLILEAGEDAFDSKVQDDYLGDTVGDTYFDLDVTRLRQFGGSSNHWGGWCRHLDAWDFEPVPEIGVPGWPITKADLDPYGERAREILEIDVPLDQPLNEHIYEAQFVYSPPVRFSEKYRHVIAESPFIHVALRSPITAMKAEDGRITNIDLFDATDAALTIAPRFVVLACGGIENSRLLLWSNEVSPQRVVANPRTLGRYWMEHPHEEAGFAVLRKPVNVNPHGPIRNFSLSVRPEKLVEMGALNAAVRLDYFQEGGLKRQARRGLCSVTPELLDLVNGVADTGKNCELEEMKVVWEQAPDPDNRITLSETESDRFGIPRPRLHWRKTALDYHTAKVAFELVGRHIVDSGAGAVRAYRPLIEMGGFPDTNEIGGNHHMGGTRMSRTPDEGVVGPDLKLHGIANGFVAGSSVFVRCGHANPTYTIVQLSLRLADHLSLEISR